MSPILLALILALPFGGAVLLLMFNISHRRHAAGLAGFVTLVACVLLAMLVADVFSGSVVRIRADWLPSLGVSFGLRMDGLAFLFALLILGIGALIVLYGGYYLSHDDPSARFFSYLLLFMGSMLGIVLADNLILLVVFWELTGLSSFLLIGYWRHREDARQGARMALVVTGAGGLALLAGVLLIGQVVGSYDLDVVLAAKETLQNSPLFMPILVLVLLGAFTKSAQFPFHFWLPRAMAAPTPVSAYLHSATMVKAGVFLLARLYPVLGDNDAWFWIVSTTGLATLLLGAVVAIFQHDIKALLAYSTVSHLGLITLLFGLDSQLAVVAGVFHIINHAVFKASLFMAAGIIDHETGSRDMRNLNGLWKAMPITATLAMVASASMAGVPLANGFLSKEMFFSETLALNAPGMFLYAAPVAATLAAIASVVYSTRFIHDVFFNGESIGLSKVPHEPPRFMRVPVEILVVICLVVGMFPAITVGPLLAVAAKGALNLGPATPLPVYSLAIWHGFNIPLLMSVIALAGGVTVYFLLHKKINLHTITKLPGDAKVLFDVFVENLLAITGAITRATQNDSLQRYLLLIVLTAIVAVAAGVWLTPQQATSTVRLASNHPPANPIVLTVATIGMVAAIGTVVMYQQRLIALILLGATGLVVSLVFLYFSAPDLALTQLLVEVVTIILMMLCLKFLPAHSPPETLPGRSRVHQWRDGVVATVAGLGVSWLLYEVLTRPFNSIAPYFLRTTVAEGGGANAVNVIIVDFRGFDTLGEIAVLGMAGLIVAVLLRNVGLSNTDSGAPPEAKMAQMHQAPSHSLMLQVVSSILLPAAAMVSIYLYLRGHNLPGGGFIAGLVFAIVLVLQYVAIGRMQVESRIKLNYGRWVGAGLLAAGLTGIGSFVVGFPFLTSAYKYFNLPVFGSVPIASAMFFDLGVYLCVIGGTMLALATLAGVPKHVDNVMVRSGGETS